MRSYAALIAVATIVGCGSEPIPNTVVPISELQPDLVTAAQKALPRVKFESARKTKVNGEDAYQIRGKLANGKVQEVEVLISGQVVDVK